ncbi:MAG: ATP-binding protein, partial [Chloroflexia bacterium]|nr:ATP-binding protein [Chloroflexia bacterium]
MRFLLDQRSYEEMQARRSHSRDCYVRGQEYLHHLYIDGVKYTIARAVYACYTEAQNRQDQDAILHLAMHISELEQLINEIRTRGDTVTSLRSIGDAPPTEDEARPQLNNSFLPPEPQNLEETGLNRTFLTEHFLRILYNKGRITGRDLADSMCLTYHIVEEIILDLRKVEHIDIIGQRGFGDINYEYILTPRGQEAAMSAMSKVQYVGPAPVVLADWVASVKAQTVQNVKVTRKN